MESPGPRPPARADLVEIVRRIEEMTRVVDALADALRTPRATPPDEIPEMHPALAPAPLEVHLAAWGVPGTEIARVLEETRLEAPVSAPAPPAPAPPVEFAPEVEPDALAFLGNLPFPEAPAPASPPRRAVIPLPPMGDFDPSIPPGHLDFLSAPAHDAPDEPLEEAPHPAAPPPAARPASRTPDPLSSVPLLDPFPITVLLAATNRGPPSPAEARAPPKPQGPLARLRTLLQQALTPPRDAWLPEPFFSAPDREGPLSALSPFESLDGPGKPRRDPARDPLEDATVFDPFPTRPPGPTKPEGEQGQTLQRFLASLDDE